MDDDDEILGLSATSKKVLRNSQQAAPTPTQARRRSKLQVIPRGQEGLLLAVQESIDLSGAPKDIIPHIRSENLPELDDTFTFLEVIGQGAFGIVNRVEHKISKRVYACKVIKKRSGSPSFYEQLMREVNIMKVVNHPHILQLYEVYESPKKIGLILEYCEGGELVKTIRARGGCSEQDIRTIILQLIDVVCICNNQAYLHKHGIVHRDIKPENILLESNKPDAPYFIKLSDFGLACFADGLNRLDNSAGTPMYMAPEVVKNLGYNHTCDIWSIGVMFYLMLCNYTREVEQKTHEMVKNGRIEYPSKYWSKIDPGAKHLCELVLKFDPAKRISAGEILQHPWLQPQGQAIAMNGNVLDLMKSYNAERRLRKAMIFVQAMVRFKSGALKVAIAKAASFASSDIASDENVLSSDSLSSKGGQKDGEREKKLGTADQNRDGRRASQEPRTAPKIAIRKSESQKPTAQSNFKK